MIVLVGDTSIGLNYDLQEDKSPSGKRSSQNRVGGDWKRQRKSGAAAVKEDGEREKMVEYMGTMGISVTALVHKMCNSPTVRTGRKESADKIREEVKNKVQKKL